MQRAIERSTVAGGSARVLAILIGFLLAGSSATAAENTAFAVASKAEPLGVFATIPDLGALAREVGGDAVIVNTMIAGREDPHYGEPRPSFIKALSEADVYLQMGMELEIGYARALLRNARNADIMPGKPGNVVASSVIEPLQVPVGTVDRSMGDVHAQGNPHFLTDPVNGLAVADLVRARLSTVRPARAEYFRKRYEDFAHRTGEALVGQRLATKYDWQKLVVLWEHEKLLAFLESQGDADDLGGWLGRMAPHRGTTAVDDHDIWPYFARRFGLEIVAHLEPVPGIPPTTRHLQGIVELMKARDVPLVVSSAYYDSRHARFIAEATGARVVVLAHQVGAVDGPTDYLAAVGHNVDAIAEALEERGGDE